MSEPTHYTVINTRSGVTLGVYPGTTPDEAIRAMLDDAGERGEPSADLIAEPVDDTETSD